MVKVLGLAALATIAVAAGGAVAVGWAYEGPRRFIRRVQLRQALR